MEIGSEEEFHLALHTFLGDMSVLALPAEEACEAMGYYNVAHELWYFLPNKYLLENKLGLFSSAQVNEMKHLFKLIQEIPKESREWTEVQEESVMNMPPWESVRSKAVEILNLLKPIIEINKVYFEIKH